MPHAVRKVVQLLVQNSQSRLPHVGSKMLSSLAVQVMINQVVRKVVQLPVQNSQSRLPHVRNRRLRSLVVQIALSHAVQINRF